MIFSRPFRLHPLHLCSLVRRFSGSLRKLEPLALSRFSRKTHQHATRDFRGRRCANTGSGSQSELLRLLRHLSSSRNILITSSACSFSSPVISARGSSEFTFFFNSHQLRWVSAKPCFKNHSLRASSRRFEMGCTFTTVSVARRAPTSRIVASLAGSRFRIRWRCLTRHIASHRVGCRQSSE